MSYLRNKQPTIIATSFTDLLNNSGYYYLISLLLTLWSFSDAFRVDSANPGFKVNESAQLDCYLGPFDLTHFYLNPALANAAIVLQNAKLVSFKGPLDSHAPLSDSVLINALPNQSIALRTVVKGGYNDWINKILTEGLKVNFPPTNITFNQSSWSPKPHQAIGHFRIEDNELPQTVRLKIIDYHHSECEEWLSLNSTFPYTLRWLGGTNEKVNCPLTIEAIDQGNLTYARTFIIELALPQHSSTTNNVLMIVGISGGVAALLVPLMLCFYRKKQQAQSNQDLHRRVEREMARVWGADPQGHRAIDVQTQEVVAQILAEERQDDVQEDSGGLQPDPLDSDLADATALQGDIEITEAKTENQNETNTDTNNPIPQTDALDINFPTKLVAMSQTATNTATASVSLSPRARIAQQTTVQVAHDVGTHVTGLIFRLFGRQQKNIPEKSATAEISESKKCN
jgi:hypothetical protein